MRVQIKPHHLCSSFLTTSNNCNLLIGVHYFHRTVITVNLYILQTLIKPDFSFRSLPPPILHDYQFPDPPRMILAANSPVRPAQSIPKFVSLLRLVDEARCLDLGFVLRPEIGRHRLSLAQRREMEFIRKLSKGCFTGRSKKGQKVEVESVYGGQDVFDPASKVIPDHLVIMVNGIIGSSEDWRYAAEQFVKKLPDKVIVHRSECNYSRLTFDGVDRMGERLAEEVWDVVTRWPEVHKISFVAHSLGGLVARYAVGRLYQHHEARVAGLEPINFITVATPHLGSRGNKQLPFLCGLPFLEKQASQTAHLIAGRSGKHLFLTDKDDGRPLLLRMVYDFNDIKFMSGLRSFKRRVAYANANYDHVVGWRTSSIRRQHELPKSDLLVRDAKYPHIVNVDLETAKGVLNEQFSFASMQTNDVEEEMIRGLTQVPWERVDVSFRKSRQRYVAHNTIQVKSYWLNSDGADVVLHMIDNFLL